MYALFSERLLLTQKHMKNDGNAKWHVRSSLNKIEPESSSEVQTYSYRKRIRNVSAPATVTTHLC